MAYDVSPGTRQNATPGEFWKLARRRRLNERQVPAKSPNVTLHNQPLRMLAVVIRDIAQSHTTEANRIKTQLIG
jgi:hypothetical protein